jgi:hypothetical protein
MALKDIKIFHSQAFQNLQKMEFLVKKYTIWQPCRARTKKFLKKILPPQQIMFTHYVMKLPSWKVCWQPG